MNNNICKCWEKQQHRRQKLDLICMYVGWMFRRFSTCVNGAVCSVRVGGRHVLLEQSRAQQPQPFRSTALDFDCESQFKSDTDCTRTNDAALFAYAVVNGTWDAGRDCPERVNPGRGCLFSGP